MSGARKGRSERGSAALLSVVLTGVLMVALVLTAAVAGVVTAQRRAETAADLGALAAAAAVQHGRMGCTESSAVIRANGAIQVSCTVVDEDVTVQVRHRGPRLFGRALDVTSRARAGPDRSSGSADSIPADPGRPVRLRG